MRFAGSYFGHLSKLIVPNHHNILQVHREALQATEQDGIVFIDEIDKIVTSSDSHFSERLQL